MDDWYVCSYAIHKFLRGWSRNRAAQAHREKDSLEAQIASLDTLADGRRRCDVDSLIINGVKVSDQSQIMAHVVDFFSSLYAVRPESGLSISHSLWDAPFRISPAENDALILPLSDEEIWDVIKSANPNVASGPDSFSIPFFKKNGHGLRPSSVKVAEVISQFRLIALINNMVKFPAKGFATRLSPVAHRTLSPFKSAFVKGRFILDGILCLHEIVHDLKSCNAKAVILKLDFEKDYDSVNWPFLRQVLLAKALSVLKINFAKSKVIITGVDDVEALRVVYLLNCSLGSFPFKYLGLPIATDKLCAEKFAPIVTKTGRLLTKPEDGNYFDMLLSKIRASTSSISRQELDV
ncbi:hypothetical protein D1007_41894 [Hordeum vulgare]|nr:hypothetical protein D1007_41894 [Hordeum vulgare]